MADSNPLVSIGLPIYNRPEGLRRTLDCLVNQTYPNIEIIIADNCSPNEDVEKIAKEYALKDSRISYYRHDANKGWGYNSNFVIDKAKGAYFMRATDDDWWDIAFIETIMNLMLQDDAIVMGLTNFVVVDEYLNQLNWYPNPLPYLQQFTSDNRFENCKKYINQFERNGKSNLYFSIVKTEIIRTKRIRELLSVEFLAGDLLMNLIALLKGKFVVSPQVLFKVTAGNVKLYDNKVPISKKIDLLFLVIDVGLIKNIYHKWNKYLYRLFWVVGESSLSFNQKLVMHFHIVRRISFFYYDIMCVCFRLRGYDIFKKMKRAQYLE